MAPNYVMMVCLITLICFSLSFGDDAMLPRHNHLIAKPNCNESCGNVNIPFPFGVTQDCILHDQFLVTCNYSFQPPRLFVNDTTTQITNISLAGQLNILQFISKDCYRDGNMTENIQPFIELPSLLSVNYTANKFIAVGCDTYAIVQGYYRKYNPYISDSYITGCMSMCNSIDDAVNGDSNSCSGVGCCQTSIPKGAWNVNITLSSYYNYTNTDMTNDRSCSYAFVVDEANFSFSKNYLSSLQNTEKLPLVLDWAIGNETCEIAKRDSTAYACKSNNSDCHDNSNGYRCSCKQGYDGNPYLKDGCQDINECIHRKPDYRCVTNAICNNIDGNYTCTCPPDFSGDGYTECNRDNPQREIQNTYLVIGVTTGVALMVIIVFGWSYTAFQRRKMLLMKKKFFQENGGLVLQQRLTGEEGSSNTIKILTAEELEKATNGFDKDRVVGQGGFGTVYKGYLKDDCVVAIKKSKVIDHNQIEQFINEVIVLSQINHRNVVKLLGCCLETEVPLLVYEFISNGTLYEHLHDKVKASTLSLDIRLRIAAETAGVLSYLHSAAYPPIIHRDIKSVNILLDKSYTAKVSDFGASRLVPADQTELSTLVQGTLGYLDPEYLQTNQLTEKSDVYSFGVVLVELLTGRKALCFERPELERSLAQYFIASVEKGHLFDILDDNIACDEGNAGQLKNVAMLAQRCLNVKGDERPTMKEVAAELEAGSRLRHSWAQTDQHSEEIESLLPGTQPLGFGYEYSEHNIHVDSITSHVALPFPGGR